jgi:hypothetical protein
MLIGSAALAQAQLASHVTVTTGPPTWSYTIFNDEPTGSPNYLSSFTLSVDAPISVTGTPDGWTYSTDSATYVYWYNQDTSLPYPHDVAPGASLDGFGIESSDATSADALYTITSWDHNADAPGPGVMASTLAPTASVPEPSVAAAVGALCIGLIGITRRRTCRAD